VINNWSKKPKLTVGKEKYQFESKADCYCVFLVRNKW